MGSSITNNSRHLKVLAEVAFLTCSGREFQMAAIYDYIQLQNEHFYLNLLHYVRCLTQVQLLFLNTRKCYLCHPLFFLKSLCDYRHSLLIHNNSKHNINTYSHMYTYIYFTSKSSLEHITSILYTYYTHVVKQTVWIHFSH